ncbi:hypothetical protein F5880DRAFT_1651579 [Lentinula raphanica]|nr:hypothetical protein F5880DRAFT_1651579 [Lentinula raphanica]
MDHPQWIQQSLQAMIANNPQLFLQMLQQNPAPSASSSNTSASISQFPQFPVASAPNPAPLSVASPPMPLLATSPPMPLSATSMPLSATSMPLSATPTFIPQSATPAPVASSTTPTPVPLSATTAAAPPNPSFPPALATLVPPSANPGSLSQSQATQPISTYMSPVSMLSSVAARSNNSGPSRSLSGSPSPSSSSFPASITAIQQANRNRLGHASSTLGHTTTTTKRKRGPGKKAPRLYGVVEPSKIEDAVAVANDGTQVVSLMVLVYPPRLTTDECNMFNIPVELHHYLQNRDAFHTVLDSLNLLHRFDNLPLNTKVVDLLEALQSSLVQSGWVFPESHDTSSFFNRHERLAIQLLRFSSKGNINNNAKTPRLSPGKVESADMTLREVVFDTNNYGIAKYAITNTKKFTLHTIIRSPNVSLNLNLKEKGLGSDDTNRQHHCLSKRIYGIFRADTNAYVDEGYRALDEEEIELGCTTSDANDEDEEVGVVAQMLRDNSETIPATQNNVSNPRNRGNLRSQNSPLSRTNILVEDTELDEVETLWTTDWVPLHEPDEDQLFYVHERSRLFKIVNDRIRAVTEAEPLGVVIKGEDPQKMFAVYTGLVQRAVDEEDFSALLSQNRHFQL